MIFKSTGNDDFTNWVVEMEKRGGPYAESQGPPCLEVKIWEIVQQRRQRSGQTHRKNTRREETSQVKKYFLSPSYVPGTVVNTGNKKIQAKRQSLPSSCLYSNGGCMVWALPQNGGAGRDSPVGEGIHGSWEKRQLRYGGQVWRVKLNWTLPTLHCSQTGLQTNH